MFKKSFLSSAMLAVGLALGAMQAHAIKTDIIMVVDESGSMSDVQTNLRNNISLFASILSAGGVDAQYGLVGYGNNAIKPRLVTDLTTPAGFATAAAGLAVSGSIEPGYTATAFALNELDNQSSLFSFRSDALKNIIIFTDEPSNGDLGNGAVNGVAVSLNVADRLLSNNQALFNAVLRVSNTITSYKPLADNHGGHVYDLNGLNTTNQTTVQNFVTDFANSKLQETIDFCTANPTAPGCSGGSIPEPASLALLGIGLAGLGFMRRRRT